ncbi:MAG: spondin domain-containing protein [Pseudomonadota bacterium]
MKLRTVTTKPGLVLLLAAAGLAACSGSSDNTQPGPINVIPNPPPPPMASFMVTVSNTTNAQPLSPIAVIAHDAGYSVFSVGAPATVGLEELAEGGSNATLLAEADASASVRTTGSGAAPIGPAGSESVSVQVLESALPGLRLSVSTMLVNTNDAFTGINGMMVGGMAVGDTMMLEGIAYDAGTEDNTELAAEIPGPAGGGEGFNAIRNDRNDQVTMHLGVVSQDDGFAMSGLTNQHRFDNPVVRVRIERTQ